MKYLVFIVQSCLTFCDPWTVAHQAPLSMEFSGQEYWSGLPFHETNAILETCLGSDLNKQNGKIIHIYMYVYGYDNKGNLYTDCIFSYAKNYFNDF